MNAVERNPERGAGKLAGILFFVFIAIAIYVGWKIVPAFVNNYEFQDALQSEARFAITNRRQPDDIRNDIWKKIVELQIPVDKKDIQIKYPGGGGPMALVDIDVPYSIDVEFPGYTLQLNFHPHGDNHSI